jgi:hypothetical protein
VNTRPDAYRHVSVAEVPFTLTVETLTAHFMGRECYRRTRYIVVRHGADTALIEVTPTDTEPLFSPAASVRVLALPHETVYVQRSDLDTAVPSQLARALDDYPAARCVVVEGRYSHVSFLLDPAPIRVRVREVVPPYPAKLAERAQRVLDLAEDLPPMLLQVEQIDLHSLAPTSGDVLLPCRGAGIEMASGVTSYLDQRPTHADWTLLGCARSREIHRWFYGENPDFVDTCPRDMPSTGTGPLLTKCCLLESDIVTTPVSGNPAAVVPWGASLAQVHEALVSLARQADPTWAPV